MRSARRWLLVVGCAVTGCGKEDPRPQEVESTRATLEELNRMTANLHAQSEAALARAQAANVQADLLNLKFGVLTYVLATARYPKRLEDLLQKTPGSAAPPLERLPIDPWGHAYAYTVSDDARGAVLASWGPDGRAGTPDDVRETVRDASAPR